MALKQLILARKIDERSKKLTEYLEERSKLEKREDELSTALSEAEAPEEGFGGIQFNTALKLC